MLKKLTTRKLTSVVIAGVLIVGGSIAMSASANAVGKQGTTCTKLKSKSGVYTCSVNPTAPTSKVLIWITADCAASAADYNSNLSDFTSYSKNATNATNQAQSLLASYQNALTVAQTSLSNFMNTNLYTIEYNSTTKLPSVQVAGYTAAIAAYQAKLAADQAGLATTTAALAKDTVGSQQAKNDQATINAYNTGIKYRQQTIDQLNKTLARIQSTITSDQTSITTWTSTVNGSIAQQKLLTKQLQAAVTTAKSTRTVACKKGL
jgi:hypothetical protein